MKHTGIQLYLPNITITYHADSFQREKYDSEEEWKVSERPHGVSGRYVRNIDKDVVQGNTEADEGKAVGERGKRRQVLEVAHPVDEDQGQ